jgi:hypothetical protein
VVTIKKLNILPVALLLIFISFSALHHSNVSTHSYQTNKAVMLIDDWSTKSQSDDEEKHLFHLSFIGELALISAIVVTIQRIFSRNRNRNFIFLLPVFHQSNYVISFPA